MVIEKKNKTFTNIHTETRIMFSISLTNAYYITHSLLTLSNNLISYLISDYYIDNLIEIFINPSDPNSKISTPKKINLRLTYPQSTSCNI